VLNLSSNEVWFVTGSQHLYGPETLQRVAEHAAVLVDASVEAVDLGDDTEARVRDQHATAIDASSDEARSIMAQPPSA